MSKELINLFFNLKEVIKPISFDPHDPYFIKGIFGKINLAYFPGILDDKLMDTLELTRYNNVEILEEALIIEHPIDSTLTKIMYYSSDIDNLEKDLKKLSLENPTEWFFNHSLRLWYETNTLDSVTFRGVVNSRDLKHIELVANGVVNLFLSKSLYFH